MAKELDSQAMSDWIDVASCFRYPRTFYGAVSKARYPIEVLSLLLFLLFHICNRRDRFRMAADVVRRSPEAEKKAIQVPPSLRHGAEDYDEWLSQLKSIVSGVRYTSRGVLRAGARLKGLSKGKDNETKIQEVSRVEALFKDLFEGKENETKIEEMDSPPKGSEVPTYAAVRRSVVSDYGTWLRRLRSIVSRVNCGHQELSRVDALFEDLSKGRENETKIEEMDSPPKGSEVPTYAAVRRSVVSDDRTWLRQWRRSIVSHVKCGHQELSRVEALFKDLFKHKENETKIEDPPAKNSSDEVQYRSSYKKSLTEAQSRRRPVSSLDRNHRQESDTVADLDNLSEENESEIQASVQQGIELTERRVRESAVPQLTELTERRRETDVNCNGLIAPAQDYSRSPSDLSINERNLGGGEGSTSSATAAAGTNSATSHTASVQKGIEVTERWVRENAVLQLTELTERRRETDVNCNGLIAPTQDYSRSPSDLSINERNLGGGEGSTSSGTAAAGTNSATSHTVIHIPPSAAPVNDELNWLWQKLTILMVAAIFIATITFQAVLNPPGGNWQDTSPNQHVAGTSIMAHNFPRYYRAFIASNAAACSASLGVILILAVGLLFKCKSCLWLLKAVMAAAIISVAFTLWIAISTNGHQEAGHQDA